MMYYITDRQFILWLVDLHCPFSVHYNGEDKSKERITFDNKVHKNFTLDEVYRFWCELKEKIV